MAFHYFFKKNMTACNSLTIFVYYYFLLSCASTLSMPKHSSTRLITNKMCPFAQKAWLALECSQIPYKMEEISLYGIGGKPDWFWKLNPSGTVPVLVQESTSHSQVWPDSDLILQAIAQGEVQCEKNMLMVTEEYHHAIEEWRTTINRMLLIGKKAVLTRGCTSSLAQLLQNEMENKLSEENDFLIGPTVTIADCHAFPFLWRLDQEFDLTKGLHCPKLGAWVERRSKQSQFSKTIQSAWWWWW